MCQLLGMNANTPTDIGFSFSGFRERGGNTDHHSDGFGIAFFEPSYCALPQHLLPDNESDIKLNAKLDAKLNNHFDSCHPSNDKVDDEPLMTKSRGLRLFHDDKPSFESPVAELVKNYPIKALNVIAHIRKATQGRNCLSNTHPFVREVWGESWVFAHNGQMNLSFLQLNQRLQDNGNAEYYQPVGTTDSEATFCYLLNRLKSAFKSRPSDAVLFAFLTQQCRYLSANGLFNCLLSNGDWHLAYASTLLFYLTRQAPFGEAKLADEDLAINFRDVTTDNDKVTIIVTIPLTKNEQWQQLAVDECLIFREGDIVFQDIPSQARHMSIDEGLAIARKVGASV